MWTYVLCGVIAALTLALLLFVFALMRMAKHSEALHTRMRKELGIE